MSDYAVNGKEPVAAWIPSRDTAGNGTTTLTDLVGSNNGILTNMDAATDWVADTGAGGVRALDFDGTDNFIELGSISGANPLKLTGGNFTICVWLKPVCTGDSFQRIIDKSDGGSVANGYAVYLDQTTWELSLAIDGAVWNSSGSPIANVWSFFVVTKAHGESPVFRLNDSVLPSSIRTGTIRSPPDGDTDARIGSWNHSTAREYKGGLDDLRVFSQVLDSTDIAYLYNSGSGRGRVAGVSSEAPKQLASNLNLNLNTPLGF